MSDVGEVLRRGLPSFVTVLGFIVCWQALVMIFHVPSWLLPAPSVIWMEFVKQSHMLGKHIVVTATGALGGLVVGAACGLVLAVLMVQSRLLSRILMPLLVIDQSVPRWHWHRSSSFGSVPA